MLSARPITTYFTNNLYDSNFFANELPTILREAGSIQASNACFEKVQRIMAEAPLTQLNESQLETRLIKPLFEMLGWYALPQEGKTVQGKHIEPDWSLFASQSAYEQYLSVSPAHRRDLLEGIITFAEVKAADKVLDTKKANRKENPFLQLLEYLTLTRSNFGFLTNGLEWWLVDNAQVTADKRYVRVNVAQIVADNNAEAFHCFYYLFHRTTFVPDTPEDTSVFARMNHLDAARRHASEENLRRVIYGTGGDDSLFETVGQAIFAATGSNADPAHLRQVYENSLYFVFRLLFIAYFEDRHWDVLQKHSHYLSLSLRTLDDTLQNAPPDAFTGWDHLQRLFITLNEGNTNLDIPLLNGGLFDTARATLLTKSKLIDNATLRDIFSALFIFGTDTTPLHRDFKALSVTHLGSIYESLLEFEFRIHANDMAYLVYKVTQGKEKGKIVEGYFDSYDASIIEKDKNTHILAQRAFPKNTLYLVGSQNSRKASASFYTPSSLSLPLVRRAIDHQLASLPENMSVLDIRILDNACGSGHLLIESLNYLTRRALDRMENDTRLAQTLADESQRIAAAMRGMGLQDDLALDEFLILKRILLKKVLYGVDIQAFAIELAHLSLWIETFIFGTPLSLIEHHVKAGNALIGSSIDTFQKAMEGRQSNLLSMTIKEQFEKLHRVYKQLSTLQDTTAEDIAHSKKLFTHEIGPALREMNLLLDMCSYKDMLTAEGKAQEATQMRVWEHAPALLRGELPNLQAELAQYRALYGFFHWEMEFPEAFANGNGQRGFHIIIGNPPWDKTKFEDPLFFSQYRSHYRNLPNSKKKALQDDLLAKPHIRQLYDKQKAHNLAVNAYYKLFYPLNKGAGDGNLFRFFVERNLKFLAQGGTLNYVLPTALLTEDGSTTLRREILENYTLTRFDGFENRQSIFPDVHRSYKFGLLQIERNSNPQQKARTRFMLVDPAVLETEDSVFDYGIDDVKAISPTHWAYMEVGQGQADLNLLARMYAMYPPLQEAWIDFRNELHSTADKGIFIEARKKENFDTYLPLYTGSMFWQFNSQFTPAEYWLDAEQFDAHLQEREISRLISDVYATMPPREGKTQENVVLAALGLHHRHELAPFVRPDRLFYRLGYRKIASDTNERTLVCALLPKDMGAQDSVYLSVPKYYAIDNATQTIIPRETPLARVVFVQAVLNSLICDWALRFSVAINVNKTYLMRQPIPQPSDKELVKNPVYQEMINNSLKLSLYYNREGFAELQTHFGLASKDIPSTTKQVDMLKIRNDVLVAGLYGINRDEMTHILTSFKVLGKKKPHYVKALIEAMGHI